jgi:hypothetical protein
MKPVILTPLEALGLRQLLNLSCAANQFLKEDQIKSITVELDICISLLPSDYTRYDELVQIARDSGHRDPEAGVSWFWSHELMVQYQEFNGRELAEAIQDGIDPVDRDLIAHELEQMDCDEYGGLLVSAKTWFMQDGMVEL